MTTHARLSAVCCAILMSGTCWTQSRLDIAVPDLLGLKQEAKAGARLQPDTRAVPMDAPLDAAEYTVGPGDIIALNIWSAAPAEHQLSVTPEAFLLIPNVGEVDVRDLTLDGVRTKVLPLVQKKYPGAQVALSLLSPRKVSVQITGQVMNEGMLEMSSVQRVDHLISSANSLPPTQTSRDFYFQDIPKLRRNASERNISIRRRDGTVQRVDLVKFRITGLSRFNPYLREGDMVYVPWRKQEDNNIGVLGGVVGPTNVEFVEGDRLTDLVQMGFGLKPLADPAHALLAREYPAGGMDTMSIDLKAILGGKSADIPLRPGDRLVIPEVPETRAGDYVTVEGAVARPGRYPITANRTSLRELIRECGGFAPNANLIATTLVRVPQEDTYRLLLSTRTSETAMDSGYYAMETALRVLGEAVSVDFRKLFVQGDSTADVTLRNLDHLVVPIAERNVYVFGQVVRPGHIPFLPGKGYKHYIDRANGFTDLARKRDVKVIKAGTRVWLDTGETEVEDGDMIWVPRDYSYPFTYYLTSAAQVAAIIGTVATLFILAKTLK